MHNMKSVFVFIHQLLVDRTSKQLGWFHRDYPNSHRTILDIVTKLNLHDVCHHPVKENNNINDQFSSQSISKTIS